MPTKESMVLLLLRTASMRTKEKEDEAMLYTDVGKLPWIQIQGMVFY